MSKKISVLTVNFNTSDFVETILYSLSKLTNNEYKVYIIDNGSEKKDYEKLKKYASQYNDVFIERWDTDLRGSMAHGTALNYLVNKVDTPYFCILDSDATWLKKGWDDILIKRFTEKVKVVGTEAPPGKPQDFPLMFAILFQTQTFKELSIDFRPKNINSAEDTGFEMREKYHQNGYIGENIDQRSTRVYKEGPFKNIVVVEFYLKGVDRIFASHFARGSSLGNAKYGKRGIFRFIYKIPYIGRGMKRRKGIFEKKEWIKICKNIIDCQNE
jgi:glycosyltransferase involved in cell wall biosynthesis